MAIEDEIINITDLDIGTDISTGDKLLVETSNGTKLLDFKDFIIGTDNISFFDKISSAFVSNSLKSKPYFGSITGKFTDIADTSNMNILLSSTPENYITKYKDISGTVELTKRNYNDLFTFSSLSADIGANTSNIRNLQADVSKILTENSLTGSVSAANFMVAVTEGFATGASSLLSFGQKEIDPVTTHTGAAMTIAPTFGLTFPSENFNNNNIFHIQISIKLNVPRMTGEMSERITLEKSTDGGTTYNVVTEFEPLKRVTREGRFNLNTSERYSLFKDNYILKINQGDKIRFSSTESKPRLLVGSRITGIRLA